MMTNLFSIFDPSSNNPLILNWVSMTTPLMFLPLWFWFLINRPFLIFNTILNYILKEMMNNLNNINFKNLLFFNSLFIFIIFNNLLGLYPYIFTSTSHISITLNLTLPLWLTLMLFGWMNLTNKMFSHLIPNGTPMALSVFMVFIETISNIIRPITLSVRLTANMIAGHLLLTLLSNISEKQPFFYLPTSFILLSLLILEYAVAMIQSYVFITLFSLYLNEIN